MVGRVAVWRARGCEIGVEGARRLGMRGRTVDVVGRGRLGPETLDGPGPGNR